MSQKPTKPKAKPIQVRGLGLSIRLFRLKTMPLPVNKIVTKLKAITYAPTSGKSKKLGAGFSKVNITGKTVTADFMADFRVVVRSHGKEGYTTKPYYSVDNASVLLKLDRGILEVRGSERIASRIRSIIA